MHIKAVRVVPARKTKIKTGITPEFLNKEDAKIFKNRTKTIPLILLENPGNAVADQPFYGEEKLWMKQYSFGSISGTDSTIRSMTS